MGTTLAASEGLIMKCLWDSKQDLTVAELVDRLKTLYNKEYAMNSVATFMTILMKKGFVTRYKIKGSYQYQPLISKQEYLDGQAEETRNDWYDGSVYGMMASLVKTSNGITEEEAQKLKELLDEYTY